LRFLSGSFPFILFCVILFPLMTFWVIAFHFPLLIWFHALGF
jgi:hypothetical protein